jgi:hypothetical protein
VQCEALEVLGRIERGRDITTAERHFQEAYDTATANGLAVWRVRALQELGTIDLFDSLDMHRLLQAREEATALGALATGGLPAGPGRLGVADVRPYLRTRPAGRAAGGDA